MITTAPTLLLRLARLIAVVVGLLVLNLVGYEILRSQNAMKAADDWAAWGGVIIIALIGRFSWSELSRRFASLRKINQKKEILDENGQRYKTARIFVRPKSEELKLSLGKPGWGAPLPRVEEMIKERSQPKRENTQPVRRKANGDVWIPQVAMAVLLFGALFDLPYAYYQLLRWAMLVGCGYWLISKLDGGPCKWRWAFIALAILYNPIDPIRFERSTWFWVNLASIAVLAGNLKSVRRASRSFLQWWYVRDGWVLVASIASVIFLLWLWLWTPKRERHPSGAELRHLEKTMKALPTH